MIVVIRPESPDDESGIRVVHDRAFGQTQEGCLVDTLPGAAQCAVSLVAEAGGRIVGHILICSVTIGMPAVDRLSMMSATAESCVAPPLGLGLAPLAVLPEFQRQGIAPSD